MSEKSRPDSEETSGRNPEHEEYAELPDVEELYYRLKWAWIDAIAICGVLLGLYQIWIMF